MIASLPMYDTVATSTANDKLWQGIRQHYGTGPATLNRAQDPHKTWLRQDLVFSQTCGLPFRTELHEHVQLVGTPDYGIPGCPPGFYYSVIVVRADDSRGTVQEFQQGRLARNDIRSQSGWAALIQDLADKHPGFDLQAKIVDTGSHAASVQAVAQGHADIAAIDAVSWALLKRDTAQTTALRVLTHTTPTPGLPYITGPHQDAARLFDAITRAIDALSPEHRACLMLEGLIRIPAAAYLEIPLP